MAANWDESQFDSLEEWPFVELVAVKEWAFERDSIVTYTPEWADTNELKEVMCWLSHYLEATPRLISKENGRCPLTPELRNHFKTLAKTLDVELQTVIAEYGKFVQRIVDGGGYIPKPAVFFLIINIKISQAINIRLLRDYLISSGRGMRFLSCY